MEYVLAVLTDPFLFGGPVSNARELRSSLRRYYTETASPAVRRDSSRALLRPMGVAIALSAVLVLGFVVVFL